MNPGNYLSSFSVHKTEKNSYSSAQGKEYLVIFSAGKKISQTLIILMCVLDPSLDHSLRVY